MPGQVGGALSRLAQNREQQEQQRQSLIQQLALQRREGEGYQNPDMTPMGPIADNRGFFARAGEALNPLNDNTIKLPDGVQDNRGLIDKLAGKSVDPYGQNERNSFAIGQNRRLAEDRKFSQTSDLELGKFQRQQGAELSKEERARQAELEREKRNQDFTLSGKSADQDFQAEQNRLNREAAEERASIMASALSERQRIAREDALEKDKKPKPIGDSQINLVADGKNAERQLAELQAVIDKNKKLFDPVRGKIGNLSPYNEDYKTLDAQLRVIRQNVGKYLEGGVLRAEDEVKYRAMLPDVEDTPTVAQQKLVQVIGLVRGKLTEQEKLLQQQGYNSAGVGPDLAQQAAVSALDADDQALLDFAKANPNDPRSAAILSTYGGQ